MTTNQLPASVIDAHTHLLPERLAMAIRDYFEAHIERALPYSPLWTLARDELRAAGVSRAWSLPYAHRAGVASGLNRWLAETFATDPFVVPGATVHPDDPVERVLEEALGELHLPIVKLHCAVGRFDVDDERLDPLWRRVSDGGQPVVIHAGRAVCGTTAVDGVAAIGKIAARWPQARLIVAHAGAPATRATLELMRRAPSVYADLAPVVRDAVALSREAIGGLEERLLFGSDMPNVSVRIEHSIDLVRSWGLAAEHESAILGGNARRLLQRM